MEDYEIYIKIQNLLEELRTQHQDEINQYIQELNNLDTVCNSQTMELQRLNTLLSEYETEIKRLRGEIL